MLIIRSIYYLLVVTCIGISLYLTYYGFLSTFGELTLPFTVVIGLVLFGADYLIQSYRERYQPITLALLLFFIGAFFSSISNFNYLYTNFMRNDVMAQTLRTQFDEFRDDMIRTRGQLTDMKAVRDEQERRELIEAELENLRAQGTDPQRPGCGERCRDHISSINARLGTTPTDLKIPGLGDESGFLAFFNTYSKLVFDSMDAAPEASTYVGVRDLQRAINELLARYNSPESALESGAGLGILAELSEASLEVERRANVFLPPDRGVKHSYIDPSLGRLGEIVYSLRNGFIEIPNTGATVMSLILAIIVDLLPVIFALIAFRPGTMDAEEEDDYGAPL